MTLSSRRIRAIASKEVRTYRRTTSLVAAMAIIPLVFLIQPLVATFTIKSEAAAVIKHQHELLYLLAIPALVPATLAAFAIVGERQQGTLEPLLTTPIRREELILAKALAVLIPSIVIAYLVFAVYVVLVVVFAHPHVATAFLRPSDIAAQIIFTPLLAAWSIWLGMAISTRAGDIRVAQQLSTLASLPSLAVTTLVATNVIHPSLRLAVGLGILLLVANRAGYRVVSALFERERLIIGTRS
jgi:ABC-2 type transport system permease protein